MKFHTITLLLFLSALSHGELYRCIDEKNKTTFSDTPCSPSAEKYQSKQRMTLKLKTIDAPKISRPKINLKNNSHSQAKSCKTFTSTQLRNLRVKDKFEKGMPASAIHKRLGQANDVRATSNNKETWKYWGARVNRTFKFKDDCLLSWNENYKGQKSELNKYQ